MITHPVLSQLAVHGVKLGLSRIEKFLQTIGEPHLAYPVVHVAGTNGKGSVCAMVTAALVEAGYRVGTNLSPHLEHLNERVQIDGVPLDDGSLTEAIETVDRARVDWAAAMGLSQAPLTYFEFVTAVAFLVFAQRQVDVAVVEVGMGGRLDATNVVQPQVCAITHIGMDHAEDLGDTLPKIALEKAGIIKPRAPVVIGPMREDARNVLIREAGRRGCELWRPGTELRREARKSGWVLATPEGTLVDVKLQLQGEHQGANASVALGVLHQLRRQGFHIPDDAIRAGLQRAFIPGRLEQILPGLLLDGAHNEDGTKSLAAWLASRPRPPSRILLFGMGAGRDPVQVLTPLLPHVDEVVTASCSHPKAIDPEDLAGHLQDLEIVLSAGGTIEETLPEVYREAHETVVAGSLYLAGAARSLARSGALAGITPGQGPAAEELEPEP